MRGIKEEDDVKREEKYGSLQRERNTEFVNDESIRRQSSDSYITNSPER